MGAEFQILIVERGRPPGANARMGKPLPYSSKQIVALPF